MIVIATNRKGGKTTEAIKIASATHSTLVVPTGFEKFVEEQAYEIGYPCEVISARKLFKDIHKCGGERRTERIVIDELDIVLREIFGAEITLVTTTGFHAQINEIINREKIIPTERRRKR